MKGFLVGVGSILGALVIGWLVYSGTISGLVSGDEDVTQGMANIQSNEKRRNDLITNLATVVEAAGFQEKSTLEAVMKARAEMTKTVINVNPADLVNDPSKLKAAQDAIGTLQGTLSRLLVSTEAYPTLKANEGYMKFMSQLEGTENRINYARENYNAAVRANNQNVRGAWGSMFAARAGAQIRTPFEVPAAQREAPVIKMNTGKS